MGALFGKQKKPQSRVTEQDKAILQVKQQRDKLKQYQKRIEQSLEKDRLIAKKCLQTGRKERAKLLLRKKKYQEKLLENTDAQLENLEKLASDIEFAQVEQQVLDRLKTGNAALSKVHEVLTIEAVESILDETRESVEKQREIDEMLTGALTQQDEDDVLAELDALVEQEEADEQATQTKPEVEKSVEDMDISEQLPDVPADELPEEERVKAAKVKTTPKKVLVEA